MSFEQQQQQQRSAKEKKNWLAKKEKEHLVIDCRWRAK